jgi:hypothetical protein
LSVRRRIFANTISDLIINLLEQTPSLGFIKTITKGDLSLLPAPEQYPEFMPAVLVDITDVFNHVHIGSTVSASAYEFTITYLKYYDIAYEYDVKQSSIKESELIADTLMEDITLKNIIIPDGRILETRTPHIGINSDQNQVFKNLKLPVIVTDINYVVYFINTKK